MTLKALYEDLDGSMIEGKKSFKIRDKVLVRGKRAKGFTARGTIETITRGGGSYGVRLENGNYSVVMLSNVKPGDGERGS